MILPMFASRRFCPLAGGGVLGGQWGSPSRSKEGSDCRNLIEILLDVPFFRAIIGKSL